MNMLRTRRQDRLTQIKTAIKEAGKVNKQKLVAYLSIKWCIANRTLEEYLRNMELNGNIKIDGKGKEQTIEWISDMNE